ncbi:S8 family serine peptidase [Adhaeribacter aquaticus]|uniref:S8 family serine peptidase n=1 Tax=Adhaeribacter aquaticus TaxID=299567 RepID=UPI000412DD4D|nr:S8 family serine peptidase [Adhaeribacter aquaticus]
MHKFLPLILPFFIFCFFLKQDALGQQGRIAVTNKQALENIAKEQEAKYKATRTKALEKAKKYKWIINETTPTGASISLQGLTSTGRPVYYATHQNLLSAVTTNTSNVWAGGASGFSLSGASSFLSGKLGIWDGGAVRPSHQEMVGRIVNRDNYLNNSDHATHVAGTMINQGIYPLAKGMSFAAPNLQSWYFDNDLSEIAAAAKELLVSNHSYGYIAGWQYMGGNWYWLGDVEVSQTEDVYFGYYDYYAQIWDDIAFKAPYYLMVKAAGNSNNMAEPAVGTPYYRYNPTLGTWELIETGRTADMRRYSGYDVIPDHSVAKNILTVGAIAEIANGYTSPTDVKGAYFSSWGPTDDGRIKPDLVGNGIRVTSSGAGSDETYYSGSGTSMAAPNIAGSLFLLQEHFGNLNDGKFMRAATLKGVAIHTANESGSAPGPDYIYGWGVMDTGKAAKVIANSGQKHVLTETTLTQGQTFTKTVVAAGTEPLRITISWTDPAGPVLPLVPTTLNNRTPSLVNDLDVRVIHGSETHMPWILNPDAPANPATRGDNIRDNVEQILITDPVPGEAYTITIKHKKELRNNAQDFSLIASGIINSWAGLSTNWQDPQNWTSGIVPDENTAITIPAGLSHYPEILHVQNISVGQITLHGQINQTGGNLIISGKITGNGSFVQTAGTLKIGGNLEVSLLSQGGSITLTGNATQEIRKGIFQDLQLQNKSGITLKDPIQVNGALTLTNGILHTGNFSVTLGAHASLAESSTAYINGQVKASHDFTNGALNHSFQNIGLTLTLPTAPGLVEVTRTTGVNGTSTIASINRYFDIQVVSGQNTGLNATMTFQYLPHELNGQVKNSLYLYRSTDKGNTWTLQTNSTADQSEEVYQVKQSGIEGFSRWTAAAPKEYTPLPITLLSFQAFKKGQETWLTWETAAEINNAGIEVEVSQNGEVYKKLGFVAPKVSKTMGVKSYRFIDQEKGKSGTRYYRLKQMDLDGTSQYYGPKVVRFSEQFAPASVYPNPNKGSFMVTVAADKSEGKINLELKDVAGKVVFQDQKLLKPGTNNLAIQLPAGVLPGIYLLTGHNASQTFTLKLAIQ